MKLSGLKKNLALSTIYQILALILPLATAPYASRVLGVDNIGIYSYTHSYSLFFAMFGALGTVSYGSREIARNRDDRAVYSRLFWEISLLTILTSAVCIFAWGIFTAFQTQYKIYYIILTASLLGTMFDISWLYAGLEQFKYTVSQNLLFKILGLIAIFIFVRKPEDLWKYILIMSLTQSLANMTMWVYLPKFVDHVSLHDIRIWHHLKETLVYFIPTIAISVYTILDKTLIGLITHDTTENGNYEQATKIVNIAKTLSFAGINMVFQSRISYLFAEENYAEIKERIRVSMDYVAFVSIGITFGIIGISERFIPLFFGSGYEGAISLLRFMAPIVLIVGISNCLGSQYYNPAGLRSQSAKFIVIGSAINFVLNLILIPHFKGIGAVIATIIAEITISSLYLKFAGEYFAVNQLLKSSWKKMIAGVLMCALIIFEGKLIHNSFLSVGVQFVSGVFLYSIVLLVLKDTFLTDTVLPQVRKLMGH